MKTGVYPNHARDRYDAFGAVNWSTLKMLKRSPKHYQHALENPPAQTPAMKLGAATHVAVLEPERFTELYAFEPDFGDCRKSENKARRDEWRAEHQGRELLSFADYTQAIGMRDAVRSHPLAQRYLAAGSAEVSMSWERCGLRCKGRLDWLSTSDAAIVDLKTTTDITLSRFQRQAANLDYHCQAAFYRDGHKRATGQLLLPFIVIAVESKPPHDVAVYRYDEDALVYGDGIVEELLRNLAYCRQKNDWPGLYADELTLSLPTWMLDADEDDVSGLGLSFGG